MRKLVYGVISLLMLMTTVSTGLLAQPAPVLANGAVPVSANPVYQEVTLGSDFTVAIDIGEVTDLNAAQFDVQFDSSVLQLDDITEGDIGGTLMPVMANELAAGHWRVVQSLTLGTANGSGQLSTLHFHSLQAGTSTVNLTDGLLSAITAIEIPSAWTGGTVLVSGDLVPVSINPHSSDVPTGSDFTVNVDIGTVNDLNAAQYDLYFNPTILRLDDITEGDIGGTAIPVASNEIGAGHWRVVQSLTLDSVNGSGTLSVLHFHALQGGMTAVNMTDGLLSALSGTEIPSAWMWGWVNVTGEPPPELLSITVTPADSTIPLGTTRQFTATGHYDGAPDKNITGIVTWASSTPGVAAISPTGLASGLSVGTTTITAALGPITSPGATLNVTESTTTVEINSGQTILLSQGVSIISSDTEGLPVTVKNLPEMGPGEGLAGFTFNISWNPAVIHVISANTSDLATGWSITSGSPNNTTGTLTVAGFTTSYSTADVTLLNLGITAVGNPGDTAMLHPGITELIDQDSGAIDAVSVDAAVLITSLVAETSLSEGITPEGCAVVDLTINRVKNPSDNMTAALNGGLVGYEAHITLPNGGMEILGVKGVAPFEVVSWNPATGVFSAENLSAGIQPNNTMVARIVVRLTGSNQNFHDLNVMVTSVVAGDSSSIPSEGMNAMTFKRGDTNGDGVIGIGDALFIAQYIVGQKTYEQIHVINGACISHDTDCDKIGIGDALFIAQYIVGQKDVYFISN